MLDVLRSAERAHRPTLSTINSDDGGQSDGAAASRTTSTAPKRTNTILSVKRRDSGKTGNIKRSDTLRSKPPLTRMPSMQTQYMAMLLHLDEIPRVFNILASLFTWIVLGAFLVVPGTFTTFKESKAFQQADKNDDNEITHAIVHSVANVGLLWVAGACCVIGVVGCMALWRRWRENYVWLINRIFLPLMMNSLAGLLTTIVNVYTAQHGIWSITARITGIVIGSCLVIAGVLFTLYNFWALRRIRKEHEHELGLEAQHADETLVEKVKRKVHEPPLQPGSVV